MRVVIYAALFLLLPCLAWGQTVLKFSQYSAASIPTYSFKNDSFIITEKLLGKHTDSTKCAEIILTRKTTYSKTGKTVKLIVEPNKISYLRKTESKDTFLVKVKNSTVKGTIELYEHQTIYSRDTAVLLPAGWFTVLDSSTIYFPSQLRSMYLNEKLVPHAFMLGVEYSPGWASRTLSINRAGPNIQQALNQRNQTEHYASGRRLALSGGYSYNRKHNFYIGSYWIKQGFTADSFIVDFASGLPALGMASKTYSFDFWGAEIGYRFSGSTRSINPVFDIGLGLQCLRSREYQNVSYINQRSLLGKIGFGFNSRPYWIRKNAEIFVIPTYYQNFRAIDNGAIKTNLHSFGINIGVAYYIH